MSGVFARYLSSFSGLFYCHLSPCYLKPFIELSETCGREVDLMPQSAPRICTKPGCNRLTLKGRCSEHPYDKGKHTDRQAKRKYSTNDPRWRRLRARQLSRQPVCEECHKQGILTPANVVDHINGDPMNNQPENLASMCWPCHSRKTAIQDGGFGNKKGEGGINR